MRNIKILKSEYITMINGAKAAFPYEGCGLIAGTIENEVKIIKKVYVLENIDKSEEHFSIDPKEQLKAIKDMRSQNLKPLGNWHSHPSTPSRPSNEDKLLAFDKSASYFIVSLKDEDVVVNSFHIENDESEKENIEII